MFLNALFCLLDCSDDCLRRCQLSIGKLKLRVHWSEVTGRPQVDVVRSKHEERAGTFRLIRYDDRQRGATGLRLTHEPQRSFARPRLA